MNEVKLKQMMYIYFFHEIYGRLDCQSDRRAKVKAAGQKGEMHLYTFGCY